MSASEKLKALEDMRESIRRVSLEDALPQIEAAVEALEWASGAGFDPDGSAWQEEFLRRSRRALAALEEVLGE